MNRRILIIICSCFILGACIQTPVVKEGGYAFISSNYPIVSVNGAEVEPVYSLDIETGSNTLIIVYNTYQHDYYCTFTWSAVENTVYEVTDQDNRYPLTLYRWVKTNSLWASRLDPVDPLECVREPRRENSADE